MFDWQQATSEQRSECLSRPAVKVGDKVKAAVEKIIDNVARNGDTALLSYAEQFDARVSPRIRVTGTELIESEFALAPELKSAIDQAYSNIKKFHQLQLPQSKKIETQSGVTCELRYQAIEAVGLYVPGGSAPLLLLS